MKDFDLDLSMTFDDGSPGATRLPGPKYPETVGWWRSWLHRHGIARELNSCYHYGPSGDGWASSYIETAIPSAWLAKWRARRPHAQVKTVERRGPLRRRWKLVP